MFQLEHQIEPILGPVAQSVQTLKHDAPHEGAEVLERAGMTVAGPEHGIGDERSDRQKRLVDQSGPRSERAFNELELGCEWDVVRKLARDGPAAVRTARWPGRTCRSCRERRSS